MSAVGLPYRASILGCTITQRRNVPVTGIMREFWCKLQLRLLSEGHERPQPLIGTIRVACTVMHASNLQNKYALLRLLRAGRVHAARTRLHAQPASRTCPCPWGLHGALAHI